MVKSCKSGANFLDKYPILLPSTMMDVDNGTGTLVHPPISSYQNDPQTRSSPETRQNETLRPAQRNGDMSETHLPAFSSSTYHPSVTEPYKFLHHSQDMNQFSIISALSETHCVTKQSPLSSLSHSQADLPEDHGKASPPTFVDVVCSRGKRYFRHPGNQRFRQIIHESVQEYIDAETRMDKSIVIDSIIDSVRAQDDSRLVRFMKHQNRSNTWTELPLEQIRDKVSHALRDAVNGLDRKKNSEL